MLKTWTLLMICGVAVSVVGCQSDLVGPDGYRVPEPDRSLDPDRVQVGEFFATPCAFGKDGNRLNHLRGDDRWITVDISFSARPGPPSRDDIRRVRDHGAWVFHTFNVQWVRARIVISQIPDMVEETGVVVYTVPDPSRYDLRAIASFARPLAGGDREMLEGLGAHVRRISDHDSVFHAIIEVPDRSIAVLLARSDLRDFSAGGLYCTQALAAHPTPEAGFGPPPSASPWPS